MSMATQYHRRGVVVAVVDASALVSHLPSDHGALLNASYDWQMNVPLLEDANSKVAHLFGVARLPTVVLVAPDGRIAMRWEGLTTPAELALEIQRRIGGR